MTRKDNQLRKENQQLQSEAAELKKQLEKLTSKFVNLFILSHNKNCNFDMRTITCTNKAYNQAEKQDCRAICKMIPRVIWKN